MARGEKEYGAKGMRWVDSKMKDGKGGFVKVRTNKPAEPTVKPKARPAAAPKPKAAPAKPKMSATAKATGSTGAGAKAKAGSARSGAARSTSGKVVDNSIVPGRAIYRAIVSAFTGKGETDAAKVASKGYRKR